MLNGTALAVEKICESSGCNRVHCASDYVSEDDSYDWVKNSGATGFWGTPNNMPTRTYNCLASGWIYGQVTILWNPGGDPVATYHDFYWDAICEYSPPPQQH